MTSPTDPRGNALQRQGGIHPHPEQVTDPVFDTPGFFDRRDLIQVKYEMLRRVRRDGVAAGKAAREAGFSRPTFYEAQTSFESGGIQALLPLKKGPRRAHKLSVEVMAFVTELRTERPTCTAVELARSIEEHFGIAVHPRSVERALVRLEKT